MTQSLINLDDVDTDIETTDYLTKEMLAGAIPDKRFRRHITDAVVDVINAEPHSEIRRIFRDNTLTYASVLMAGRYSLSAYVAAVKYVSLKLLGDKSSVAYSKVFPDRYQALVDKGTTPSQIASFADNYGKTGLVIKIFEQTMVPTHILNAGSRQEAINKQVELMRTAKSEMVQQKAAECLIANLAPPETAKLEIDVTEGASNAMEDLKTATRLLAKQQLSLIMNGQASAEEIAKSTILADKPIDV